MVSCRNYDPTNFSGQDTSGSLSEHCGATECKVHFKADPQIICKGFRTAGITDFM